MKKFAALLIFGLFFVLPLPGQETSPSGLSIVAETGRGIRALLDDERTVLFLEGTAEEMGRAHGELYADEVKAISAKVTTVGLAYTLKKKTSFAKTVAEAENRARPFTPERFFREMDALAAAADLSPKAVRQINFFPEMFHCSGAAVRGRATPDGRVRHVRVLDYMRDIGMQNYATLIVFMPSEKIDGRPLNAWVSVSYPGFLGAVTCMNERGLAMGEMGGGGEGKWDGLSMTFLMRRVMEECATVEEAIALMKSVPLTCDYYYVLSDKNRSIAAVAAIAGTENAVAVIRPNEDYPDGLPGNAKLPKKFEDIVYISGQGERINALAGRLEENYGKIDAQKMIEIVKRPVCMKSNLHNAVFEPETLDLWFAEAGRKTIAADEKYFRANLAELVRFYQENKTRP